MLLGFNVGNFLSISDIQHFSMVAGTPKELPNHVVRSPLANILRGSFIYGTNASGKSNFVRAFTYSRDVVLGRIGDVHDTNVPRLSHRNKHDVYSESPSYFEYNLLIDGMIYSYGFEIDTPSRRILCEWLFQSIDQEEEMIFTIDRNSGGVSKTAFPSLDSDLSEFLSSGTQGTFLSYIVSDRNRFVKEIQAVYNWFQYNLVTLTAEESTFSMVIKDGFLDRLVFYLKHLDTGINGFRRNKVENIQHKSQIQGLTKTFINDPYMMFNEGASPDKSMRKKLFIPDEYSEYDSITIDRIMEYVNHDARCILFSNNAMFEFYKNGSTMVCDEITFLHGKSSFFLPFKDESQGTRRLIHMLAMFEMSYLISTDFPATPFADRTLVIDELECSIHTLATMALVKIFYDRPGSEDSQLIATTHESRLLSQNHIRKDEVWFVDVSDIGDDRTSSIYSLEAFDDPHEEFIDIAYLEGKYGAIPFLKELRDSEDGS